MKISIPANRTSFVRCLAISAAMIFGPGQVMANFVGVSAGTFLDPVGPGGMVTTGVGTDTFTWGTPAAGTPPSSLSFSGVGFSAPAETDFLLGTLTYFNGAIVSNSGADLVNLNLALLFSDPSGLFEAFNFTLGLINTPNANISQADDADYVTIPTVSGTTFNVGPDVYTLAVSFANFSASSFGGPNEFRVFENASATVEVHGKITTNLAGVPDSGSTAALIGLALVAFAGIRRKLAAR